MDQILDNLEETEQEALALAAAAAAVEAPPAAAEAPPAAPTVDRLLAENERLRGRLAAAESQLDGWKAAASDGACAAFCSPRMCSYYASMCDHELRKNLMATEGVTAVRWLQCSFPATRSSGPRLVLLDWATGLGGSRWSVDWAPPWGVEVCVEGSHYISATAVFKMRRLALQSDALELRFNGDLSQVEFRFTTAPAINFEVESEVGGLVGLLPVEQTLEQMVRASMAEAVQSQCVAPNWFLLELVDNEKVWQGWDAAAEQVTCPTCTRSACGLLNCSLRSLRP